MPRDKKLSHKKVLDAAKKEFLTAYITAIIEPMIHEYDETETEHCLMKVAEFFTPGWMRIMGF